SPLSVFDGGDADGQETPVPPDESRPVPGRTRTGISGRVLQVAFAPAIEASRGSHDVRHGSLGTALAALLPVLMRAVSACQGPAATAAAPTPVTTSVEGLPIPYGASLKGSASDAAGFQSQDYALATGVPIQSVDDWYDANLPPGHPWHDWQACPAITPPPGVNVELHTVGVQRSWHKNGRVLMLLASPGRGGGRVGVNVAEYVPPQSPAGLSTPCKSATS